MADTKPNSQLLSEIQASDSKVLKDVTTVENPAAKHDMAMVSWGSPMSGMWQNVDIGPFLFWLEKYCNFNLFSIFIIILKSFVKFLFSKSESYNSFNFSSELPSLTRTSSKQLRLSRRMFCLQPTISRKKRVTKNICINDHCLYDFAFILSIFNVFWIKVFCNWWVISELFKIDTNLFSTRKSESLINECRSRAQITFVETREYFYWESLFNILRVPLPVPVSGLSQQNQIKARLVTVILA